MKLLTTVFIFNSAIQAFITTRPLYGYGGNPVNVWRPAGTYQVITPKPSKKYNYKRPKSLKEAIDRVDAGGRNLARRLNPKTYDKVCADSCLPELDKFRDILDEFIECTKDHLAKTTTTTKTPPIVDNNKPSPYRPYHSTAYDVDNTDSSEGNNGQPGTPGGHNGQPGTPGGNNGQPGTPGGNNGQPGTPGGNNGQPGTPGEGHNGQPGTGEGSNGEPGTPGEGSNGQPGTPGEGNNGQPGTPGEGNDEPGIPGEGNNGQPGTPGEGNNGQPGTPGEGNDEPGLPGEGNNGQPGTPGEGSNGEPGTPGEGNNGQPGTPGEGNNGGPGTPGEGNNGLPGVPGSNSGQPGTPGSNSGQPGVPGSNSGQPGTPGSNSGQPGVPGSNSGQPGTPGTNSGQPGTPGSNSGQPGTPGSNNGQPGTPGTPGEGNNGEPGTPGEGNNGEPGTPGEGNNGEPGTPGEGNNGEPGIPGEGNNGQPGTPGEGNNGQPETPGEGNNGQPGTPGEGNNGQPGTPGEGNNGQPGTPGEGNNGQPGTPGVRTTPPPSPCPGREEWKDCGSNCPVTCDEDNTGIVQTCTEVCVAGCFCRSGYVRNKIGYCITDLECEAKKKGELISDLPLSPDEIEGNRQKLPEICVDTGLCDWGPGGRLCRDRCSSFYATYCKKHGVICFNDLRFFKKAQVEACVEHCASDQLNIEPDFFKREEYDLNKIQAFTTQHIHDEYICDADNINCTWQTRDAMIEACRAGAHFCYLKPDRVDDFDAVNECLAECRRLNEDLNNTIDEIVRENPNPIPNIPLDEIQEITKEYCRSKDFLCAGRPERCTYQCHIALQRTCREKPYECFLDEEPTNQVPVIKSCLDTCLEDDPRLDYRLEQILQNNPPTTTTTTTQATTTTPKPDEIGNIPQAEILDIMGELCVSQGQCYPTAEFCIRDCAYLFAQNCKEDAVFTCFREDKTKEEMLDCANQCREAKPDDVQSNLDRITNKTPYKIMSKEYVDDQMFRDHVIAEGHCAPTHETCLAEVIRHFKGFCGRNDFQCNAQELVDHPITVNLANGISGSQQDCLKTCWESKQNLRSYTQQSAERYPAREMEWGLNVMKNKINTYCISEGICSNKGRDRNCRSACIDAHLDACRVGTHECFYRRFENDDINSCLTTCRAEDEALDQALISVHNDSILNE